MIMSGNDNSKKRSRFSSIAAKVGYGISKDISQIPPGDITEESDYLSMPLPQLNSKEIFVRNPIPGEQKSLKDIMISNFEAAVAQPLSETNKGFRLLQKMGFNVGDGLGRDNNGIVAPIKVKTESRGRAGLGVLEAREKRKCTLEAEKINKRMKTELLESDYRERLRSDKGAKERRKYVQRAEVAIFELDTRARIGSHALWPTHESELKAAVTEDATIDNYDDDDDDDSMKKKEEVKSSDDEINDDTYIADRLAACNHYLRSEYNYCVYCGAEYLDESDLSANCPGLSLEDH